ncbi:MAG: radical SAM protein [Thermoleophilia bacterium]
MPATIKKPAAGRRAGSAASVPGRTAPLDLSWVDGFIASIRPYVRVREQDSLLIKMPNQAYRINSTGVKVLGRLLEGGTVGDLLAEVGSSRADDIALFLLAVKRCLEGDLRETDRSAAVEPQPLALNFSSLPVLAEIAVTGSCNLRCVFCYAGCAGGSAARRREAVMPGDKVRRAIDSILDDAGVPSLSFTGGEPTLRHDLPELVAYAAGRGMRVNLITNGTLMTPELAAALAAAGLASAQVSIEGATVATHDAVTGVSGSFRKSLEGIERLRAAGIHVHANTTINRINIDECVEIPRLTAGLGLERFSMNLVIPSGSAAANIDALVRYSEVAPVLEEVIIASELRGVEFMWYSPTPLCIFNPVIHGLGNKGCSACDGLLSIDPAGDILPCSSCDDPVGNLLEDGFGASWDSRKSRMYRSKSLAHPSCPECDSFAVCHGGCPLYWRHFGFGELTEARGLPAADRPAFALAGESAPGSRPADQGGTR